MRLSPQGRQISLCRDQLELWKVVIRYPIPGEQRCQLFCFARELCIMLLRTPPSRFTRRAERLLKKYLSRGLAGSLLQEVGEQVIAWRFIPKESRRG